MVAMLPAYARLVDLRLRIDAPTDDGARPITRQNLPPESMAELWKGDLVFAPLSRENTHALCAFLETLDGRREAFGLRLEAGKFSATYPKTLDWWTAPGLGAGQLVVQTSGTGYVPAGLLLTLGDIDSGDYQLVEVLADAPISGSLATLKVAPRVRGVFTTMSPLVRGTVIAKLRLASDTVDASVRVSHGVVTASVVEAL